LLWIVVLFLFLCFFVSLFLYFQQIMNLPSLFLLACDELGGESYVRECLAQHFADVCCDGDVVLQEILGSSMTPTAIGIVVGRKEELAHSAIEVLSGTLEHWRKDGKCSIDVWW